MLRDRQVLAVRLHGNLPMVDGGEVQRLIQFVAGVQQAGGCAASATEEISGVDLAALHATFAFWWQAQMQRTTPSKPASGQSI
jgi:hypothetical protein